MDYQVKACCPGYAYKQMRSKTLKIYVLRSKTLPNIYGSYLIPIYLKKSQKNLDKITKYMES